MFKSNISATSAHGKYILAKVWWKKTMEDLNAQTKTNQTNK